MLDALFFALSYVMVDSSREAHLAECSADSAGLIFARRLQDSGPLQGLQVVR